MQAERFDGTQLHRSASGGSWDNDGPDIREALRRHLKERMVARDKPAVQAIRAAVAVIENAEAQPADDSSHTEQLLCASTSADVARRIVTDEDARALVAGEIEELHAAARHYRSIGEPESAATIEWQADLLRQILSPERLGWPGFSCGTSEETDPSRTPTPDR